MIISKHLHILFRNCLEKECFPNEWKKANVVPSFKKGDNQLINNYQPVSLFPICAKVFEQNIFISYFEYLDINKLLNNNQSTFLLGDYVHHYFQ